MQDFAREAEVYYEEGRIGPFVVEESLILGHESMGTIVGLGDETAKHEIGAG